VAAPSSTASPTRAHSPASWPRKAALLGHPRVIFCHYDPLLPPLLGATDITAAETRLKEIPGQGYLRLEYGAPTLILPRRS
jgi:diadenosine tetraphosphatase ApaH/serine/threonine PP2A family protein phosphatase